MLYLVKYWSVTQGASSIRYERTLVLDSYSTIRYLMGKGFHEEEIIFFISYANMDIQPEENFPSILTDEEFSRYEITKYKEEQKQHFY